MKKTIFLKGAVFSIVFLLSLFGFNHYFSGKTEGVTEMLGATLPIVQIYVDEMAVNEMHGYLGQIDAALMRDAVTPVEANTELKIAVTDYDYDITAVSYQVFYGSNSELLEEGVLNKLEEVDGKKVQTLKFQNRLNEGEEYLVCYTIRLDSSRKVHYYSRLKYGVGFHQEENIEFAIELSNMMLAKDEALNRYIEPDNEIYNNNLSTVSIHSNFAAVTYGQAKPERVGDMEVTVKEINSDYTVVELRFILAMKNSKGQLQYCDVVENYKVRYSANRMYLLDYSRSQEAFYNPEIIDAAKNRITLGTGTTTGIDYVVDAENEKVCFVKNRQLWYYSYQSASVTKVFSFWNEDKTERRSGYDQHNIHILNMDESGNIEFIVYGYMNRGRHEGQNGIAIYRFLTENSSLHELAFIPSTIPYENMKEEVEKFSYLNEADIFFFLQDGVLYRVDTITGEWETIRQNLINNSLTASSDHHMIAIQEKEDSTKNQKIDIINLENGEERTISCEADQRIQSVGFVLSDFIYGIADVSDVEVTNSGSILFPMRKIHIAGETGSGVKTYYKEGYYIVQTEVKGNVINLTYSRNKTADENTQVTDNIIFKEEKEGGSVSTEYGYDSICYNQVYLAFPPYIYVQTVPSLKVAKEIISDDMQVVNLIEEKSDIARYLVYANGALVESYNTTPEAIAKADEIRGIVVNNDRQTVWESNIASYNQVVGMSHYNVETTEDTFAACVSMAAALEGQETEIEDIKKAEGTNWEILGRYTGKKGLNLYGTELSQILYYVGRETPVIVGLGGDHYVVLMSYNNTKIRYKDPLKEDDVVVSRSEFEAMMNRSGKEYYSYIK
ncbi:MAG: hypothetical protein E7253_02390 [Lachnospiraceae bacterium]|nr:hypothetical protein [Lachnospiraceae bacterium]